MLGLEGSVPASLLQSVLLTASDLVQQQCTQLVSSRCSQQRDRQQVLQRQLWSSGAPSTNGSPTPGCRVLRTVVRNLLSRSGVHCLSHKSWTQELLSAHRSGFGANSTLCMCCLSPSCHARDVSCNLAQCRAYRGSVHKLIISVCSE